MDSPFERRIQWAAWFSMACYFGLLLSFVFKTVIAPMGGREPNFTMLAVHTLPLLLFLPGILRRNQRTYAWLSFLLLLYFVLTVEGLFSPFASNYHWLALALLVGLFCGCIGFIRWTGMAYKWQASATGEVGKT
jgi:uncharacterized membrane protein